jgi:hypothetical protein
MTLHRLKCWPKYFKEIVAGDKRFDLRKDDRAFEVGDELILEEWTPVGGYTGNVEPYTISYILRDFEGLQDGYCILGLASPFWEDAIDP